MSQLYDALTVANDEAVEQLESLSLIKELTADCEDEGVWQPHPGIPLTGRVKDYPAQLPGRISHKRIRAYLVLAFFVLGLVLLGTEYAFRPGQRAFAKEVGVYGVAFEGTIHPAVEIRITSALTGTVSAIFVKVGETAKPGQPLLRLDDHDAELNLEQAGAELRAAEANLEKFHLQLAEANARVAIAQRQEQLVPSRQWRDSPERARAAYDLALTNYNRAKQLFDAGVIAQQELDSRATDLKMAQDDLDNATRLANASAQLEHEQAEQANLQARVTRQELQEQFRQAQLKYQRAKQEAEGTVVRATQEGVVSEISAKLGDRIPGGTVLVRLAELERMIVDVPVSGTMLADLKVGQKADVELPSSPPRKVRGQIHVINPLPSENMMHTVEVQFENPTLTLLAGQPAEVRFRKP